MRRTFRSALLTALLVTGVAVTAGYTQQQQQQPAQAAVKMVKLPVELPSVGDVDRAARWQFGRIDQITARGADELTIRVRTEAAQDIDLTISRAPFVALAQASGWISENPQNVTGRSEYAERLLAFGLDDGGRVVAAISMEPFDRNRARLRRAICR
ncbi:MAG: hypothetical protein ACF8R7_03025 [Phycisphaerales bacterium JB039]